MSEDLYKIGAVAKRTGISPECLRAWERRYGLEPAERAGQTRFYSTEQVSRLTSIKSLLDQGHPISQVIRLNPAELQRRLHPPRLNTQSRRGHIGRGRIGVVGSQLIHAYRTAEHPKVKPSAEWATLVDLEEDQEALPPLDGVVVYLPSLEPQHIELLEKIYPAARIVVAFRYATAADLDFFRESGHALLRWPANWEAVEKLVAASQSLLPAASTARLYSDEELCHIRLTAARASSECASDLARLIGEMNDFAVHAMRCNDDEDHALIEEDLHTARAQLERSLQALVEKHGLLAAPN